MINHSQKNIIKMTLPTEPKLISVIRMTASSIANHIGFNIEEIEDVKIAVSEACSNVIKYSNVETFDLYFSSGEDFIEVQVEDKGTGCNSEEIKDPIFETKNQRNCPIALQQYLLDNISHSAPQEYSQ